MKSYGSTEVTSSTSSSSLTSSTTYYDNSSKITPELDSLLPTTSTLSNSNIERSLSSSSVSSSSSNISGLHRVRLQVARIVNNVFFQWFIVILILINAVILGLETIPSTTAEFGHLFPILNWICMSIFIAEVSAKFFAEGLDFFKNGWNYFDVIVLALSVAPKTGPWSAFYALRCLRVLRIVSTAKPVKLVAESFVVSLYTASPVFALLFLILYIASLLAVNFFGQDFPEWYGTLPRSLFTMFQVVTLESWSMGIARPIMEIYPLAWIFFVPFIMLSTWTVLNLFIGVVVNTISEIAKRYAEIEEKEQAELDAKIKKELGLQTELHLFGSPSRSASNDQVSSK